MSNQKSSLSPKANARSAITMLVKKGVSHAFGMILTMIMARSSESSLTIELTVEYKIGLAQPDTPNRYHAKNLFPKESASDRTTFECKEVRDSL